jgi:hypothetical protein
MTWREASITQIEEYAYWVYCALDNMSEFGEETRMAIIDTAGDALVGDGFEYDRDELVRIAKRLAG